MYTQLLSFPYFLTELLWLNVCSHSFEERSVTRLLIDELLIIITPQFSISKKKVKRQPTKMLHFLLHVINGWTSEVNGG